MAAQSLVLRMIAEFIATFFFLSVVLLTGSPLAIASALMGAVYFSSAYSGGVLNPAASLSLMLTKQLSGTQAGGYVVAQMAAAVAAFAYFKYAPAAKVPLPSA